jgi:hypothetical protein
MKNSILLLTAFISFTLFAQQKTAVPASKFTPAELAKINQDKAAIKAMAGIYKVNFEFAETFSPDTTYKYHDRKFDWGIEYVTILEETETKVVLQHLLIVSDTMIVKHWRQDWIYQNTEIHGYYKDDTWKKVTLPAEKVKGTWTQKVFQVDDSPRYEGYGTWVHVDGRHFWESVADAPLPRRELPRKAEYNVLKRHSHIEIDATGWTFNQDNEKILRKDGVDKLICWERGVEKFTTGAYNAQPAIEYWTKTSKYWADVRKVWTEVYAANPSLSIIKRVENQLLFEKLFDLADKYSDPAKYNSAEAVVEVRNAINSFIQK